MADITINIQFNPKWYQLPALWLIKIAAGWLGFTYKVK